MELKPEGVLVSSDSNPEELGLTAAATSAQIATIFVSHAYTTSVSPPLNFSLSVLEGEAALAAHARKGPVKGSVHLSGVPGPSYPMDASRLQRSGPVIGIFAPKVVGWSGLREIIEGCRRRFRPLRIMIRWHPSMLGKPMLGTVLDDVSDIVETPPQAKLFDVATQCDWVIADPGSNVNMDVLKLGIPTIAVGQLGTLDQEQVDLYGFVSDGIIYPPVATITDLSVDDAVAFYSDDWAQRFLRYDASYLRAEEDFSRGLASAIRAVLAGRPSHRPDVALV
jgi:hypothetical protein